MLTYHDGPVIVTTEKEGRVVVVRYNRPEDRNRSDYAMKERLADVYEAIAQDQDIRVLILTGTGAYFAAGGKVNAADEEESRRFQAAHKRVLDAQRLVKIPVIAAINGDVLGGAIGDVLTADFAVAVEGSQFGFTQAKRGSFPISSMAITMDFLPQKFALEAFYSGKMYPMERALEMGLINRIVAADDLWKAVYEYADMVLALPKGIVGIGRKAYFDQQSMVLEERLRYSESVVEEILQEEAKIQRQDTQK